jgi:hypothetical protein
MIQSNSTHIEPIQKRWITEASQKKRMNSFLGESSNPYPRKKMRKVVIRIGNDVFRAISGSVIEKQSISYKNRIRKIGILLGGEMNVRWFSKFIQWK